MNSDELKEIKERLIPYIRTAMESDSFDMVFLMLTDILNESSELIFYGSNAENLIENAFGVVCEDSSALLPGIVSRKKQLIPAIMESLQQ